MFILRLLDRTSIFLLFCKCLVTITFLGSRESDECRFLALHEADHAVAMSSVKPTLGAESSGERATLQKSFVSSTDWIARLLCYGTRRKIL